MIDDENQETRESPAVSTDDQAPGSGEVSFSLREDDQAGGDPITAAGGPSDSPAGAQARAESGDESPLERPEVQILGAFVGAFILAKLLQKLFSRD